MARRGPLQKVLQAPPGSRPRKGPASLHISFSPAQVLFSLDPRYLGRSNVPTVREIATQQRERVTSKEAQPLRVSSREAPQVYTDALTRPEGLTVKRL